MNTQFKLQIYGVSEYAHYTLNMSYVDASVLSNVECQTIMTNNGTPERYHEKSTCVRVNADYQNTFLCDGGSPGGDMLVSKSNRVLLGIKSVSYCLDGTPFTFSRLPYFADWITVTTNVVGVDVI